MNKLRELKLKAWELSQNVVGKFWPVTPCWGCLCFITQFRQKYIKFRILTLFCMQIWELRLIRAWINCDMFLWDKLLQGPKTANKSSSIKIQKSVEPQKMFQLHQIFFQLIDINHNNDTKSWICNRLSFSKDKGLKMMKIMGKISFFWFLSIRKAHLASRKHAETCCS